jgi:hypothetical protein
MSARHLIVVAAALLGGTTALPGQSVGSLPVNSPFRDVEKRQSVTLLSGISIGGKDIAGAAPRGGIAQGIRYDVPLGGSPLDFTGILMRQAATRDLLQPGLPLANRIGGSVSEGLWMLDAAFTIRVTGGKSWHSLVPYVTAGAGFVVGAGSATDSSGFAMGSRFAPSGGLGLKFAPERSRWTVRADITNRFYSVRFPQSFRDSTPNVPRIVGPNSRNDWVRNTMFTLGLVREFGRR